MSFQPRRNNCIKSTSIYRQSEEEIEKTFEWPVQEPPRADEVVTVYLMVRKKHGKPELFGVCRLTVPVTVTTEELQVRGKLVDENSRATDVYITIAVRRIVSESDAPGPLPDSPAPRRSKHKTDRGLSAPSGSPRTRSILKGVRGIMQRVGRSLSRRDRRSEDKQPLLSVAGPSTEQATGEISTPSKKIRSCPETPLKKIYKRMIRSEEKQPLLPIAGPSSRRVEPPRPEQVPLQPEDEPFEAAQEPSEHETPTKIAYSCPVTPKKQIIRSEEKQPLLSIAGTSSESEEESSEADQAPSEPEEEPSEPEEEPSKPEQAPSKPEEEPSEADQAPSEPEEEPSKPEQAPSKPEEEPSEADQASSEPDQASSEPEEEPSEPEEEPSKPEQAPSKPEEEPSEADQAPSEPEEEPLELEQAPSKPEEEPFEAHPDPLEPEAPTQIASSCPVTPRAKQMSGDRTALKLGHYQVKVYIEQISQLAGPKLEPIVRVTVGAGTNYVFIDRDTGYSHVENEYVFNVPVPNRMANTTITLSVHNSWFFNLVEKPIGVFKTDMATIYQDRSLRWVRLTDPEDPTSVKGYLKCSIEVARLQPRSYYRGQEDVVLPTGIVMQRRLCRLVVKLHRADGLPRMNNKILGNVKKAITREHQELVSPYVEVTFATMKGTTSVKRNSANPVWNEEVCFTKHVTFPPLYQRIKIQLRDDDPVRPRVIGTHFIALTDISNEGVVGFLPTFGPTFVYFYGATRDYNIVDRRETRNKGLKEGIAYRGRLLMSMSTQTLSDDTTEIPVGVTSRPTAPVDERAVANKQFFLFATVFEFALLEKDLEKKKIQLELSIGNAGNDLDGHYRSIDSPGTLANNLDGVDCDVGYWRSTTRPELALPRAGHVAYLSSSTSKQCMHVRCVWPDLRRRLYNSNMIAKIVDEFEGGLCDARDAAELTAKPDEECVARARSVLEAASQACEEYVAYVISSPPLGNTTLDRNRRELCMAEIEEVSASLSDLAEVLTPKTLKDKLQAAVPYLTRLKNLCEDAQPSMPDIVISAISEGKRIGYKRIQARQIIFSENEAEAGNLCGKIQTTYLKWHGSKALPGWVLPAELKIYLWLGALDDKRHFMDGLPPGFEKNYDTNNAEDPMAHPPAILHYAPEETPKEI